LAADTGVVDPYHRLFGYDGLHVIDGSTIGANLGVNPALTITKGEPDARPAVGEAYRTVAPVAPREPAVPAHAPAAPRLV
jgi:cholesterol oxidase